MPVESQESDIRRTGEREPAASSIILLALIPTAAFALYWGSSFLLETRKATTHFGADTWYYAELAKENVIANIANSYHLDRVARFHPVTVAIAAAWMQIFGFLTPWIAPLSLLKALFSAVGAVGVWAAMWAFRAVAPRGNAALFGIIYAVSFGVWYFASIEESKIVSASLAALYIAIYMHLRDRWTVLGAALLTGVLLLACLNEMVSGFLVAIPALDTLLRYGWDWRRGRWIALHALAGPTAFAIIEGILFGRLVAVSHPEGTSHFGMLFFYISRNKYTLAQLYEFVINWLFFNIAAPTPHALHAVPAWANYKGYFTPSLANYLRAPASAALVGLVVAMAVMTFLRSSRIKSVPGAAGLLLAFGCYSLVRAVFFAVFNPYEPLLFSPSVTLAHMLILGIPFAASEVPMKPIWLGALAALLFLVNGAFIIGP